MGEQWGREMVFGTLQTCQAERFPNQSLGPHHCSPSSSKPPTAGAAPSLPSQSISDAEPAALTSPGMCAAARRVLCTSWHASTSSAARKECAMVATQSAAQLSLRQLYSAVTWIPASPQRRPSAAGPAASQFCFPLSQLAWGNACAWGRAGNGSTRAKVQAAELGETRKASPCW